MTLYKFLMEKGRKLKADEDAAKEGAITRELRDLGFWNRLEKDFDLRVKGDKVKLEGAVADQETREKIILAAGNVEGIAEVEDGTKLMAAEAKTVSEEAVFYEVKSGDTLSKIAKSHYGDAMRYPEIFEANKPMLTDPDLIYPGQVLRIPGGRAGA